MNNIYVSISGILILLFLYIVLYYSSKRKDEKSLSPIIIDDSFIIHNSFPLIMLGGFLGFIAGIYIADLKDALVAEKTLIWQFLESPVEFTQISGASPNAIWAQTTDGQIYFWNFNCDIQETCKQWVATENTENVFEYTLERNNSCSFTNTPLAKPSKEPPGKVIECTRVDFTQFYALLEDGTIWYWEIPINRRDTLPLESIIFAFIGIILSTKLSSFLYAKRQA